MKTIDKFDKYFLNFLKRLLSLIFVSMFIIVIIGIFSRYIFKKPIFGTEELARYLMLYLIMIGSAVAFRQEKHPSIILIIEKIPINYLRIYNFFKDTIIIIILIIIFKEGYIIAIDSAIMKSPGLRISLFWVYIAFPIGSLLMIFQIIAKNIFGKNN